MRSKRHAEQSRCRSGQLAHSGSLAERLAAKRRAVQYGLDRQRPMLDITMASIPPTYIKEAFMQSTNDATSVKKLRGIQRSVDQHWVGDGFPVRTLFAYPNLGAALSPFLLLDYAGPTEFEPTDARLGVGEHPHRGFETVTIVYEGEVEHRDSSGGGGKIGPGDVQWMTAASGIVHEEFHGRDFARRGGLFEMVQLWVNLPAEDKMAPPGYQSIVNSQIPTVNLPDGQGTVRVIAGEFSGAKGPATDLHPHPRVGPPSYQQPTDRPGGARWLHNSACGAQRGAAR